jgi:hypothetical protein
MVTTSMLPSGKHRRCHSMEHRLTTSTAAHSSRKKKQHHPCLAPTQVTCFHFCLVLKSILLSASTATAKIPPLPSSNLSYDYAAEEREFQASCTKPNSISARRKNRMSTNRLLSHPTSNQYMTSRLDPCRSFSLICTSP